MFDYLRGTLVEISPIKAILDVGGIGYSLFIPLSLYGKLPQAGTSYTLFVSLIIRENAHTLYGFSSRPERDLFNTLCEVSGIGPKTALALVGHMEPSDLHLAITQSQLSVLCKIPGIGRKTAERLILEMRDRLKPYEEQHPLSATSGTTHQPTVANDALNALINLGYNALHAQKAVKAALTGIQEDPDLAKLITAALRCI